MVYMANCVYNDSSAVISQMIPLTDEQRILLNTPIVYSCVKPVYNCKCVYLVARLIPALTPRIYVFAYKKRTSAKNVNKQTPASASRRPDVFV